MTDTISRAQGTLLGQLAGDALGSLVEFQSPAAIGRQYPDGVRLLADGGTWDTIAGQPTDDSEMALALARSIVEHGKYIPDAARRVYVDWYNSHPFDCGGTISSALNGRTNPESQANGALMRISPLGIFGANHEPAQVARWARQDAALTHPHPICQDANALFAMAIAHAIRTGCSNSELFAEILEWATQLNVDRTLREAIEGATSSPPADYMDKKGWVLVALRNALWQLLHAPDLEAGVIDTVMRGGDTDTNAAIAGALLGAVYGGEAIPRQWADSLKNCRPQRGRPGVRQPRPEIYWPVDAEELAMRLHGHPRRPD
jgi:ADP-ribosylglycohydrolase